ncbi:hypothetical protein [Allostreptomyces psammosilenae]|uniref:Uncharacterized protein n=1 Tax=Allostreptomyces psammosilenae TaxID=1892865 RepID=A0A853A1A7_9ACTN|nr:hypothetical protein [Allostreptomyces psammosilenae]NYI08346.1 hypothetical protein [Allostreptomyces psammosilenae]
MNATPSSSAEPPGQPEPRDRPPVPDAEAKAAPPAPEPWAAPAAPAGPPAPAGAPAPVGAAAPGWGPPPTGYAPPFPPPAGPAPTGQWGQAGAATGAWPPGYAGHPLPAGRPRRRWPLIVALATAGVVVVAGAVGLGQVLGDQDTAAGPVPPASGGAQAGPDGEGEQPWPQDGQDGAGPRGGGEEADPEDGGSADGGAQGEDAQGMGQPTPEQSTGAPDGSSTITDEVSGFAVPLPEGWTGSTSSDGYASMSTGSYECELSEDGCVRALVYTGATSAPDPEAAAETVMPEFVASSMGESDPEYTEERAERVEVLGQEGYLLRWYVTPETGTPGWSQVVAFPAVAGGAVVDGVYSVVLFGFDDSAEAPDPALMDEILQGISPTGTAENAV